MRLVALVVGTAALCAAGSVFAGPVQADYASRVSFGRTTAGVNRQTQAYTVGTDNWTANLVPPTVSEINNTGGEFFFAQLAAEYPAASGWSFSSAVNTLSNNSLKIHTYAVTGSAGFVGAEIDIEYVPGVGDPTANIHWIQVVRDNHNVTGNPGHGNGELVVDQNNGRRSPYYDDGFAANSRNFYDFSGRNDGGATHLWQAELYLVVGPAATAPGPVTIYRTGMAWGWNNIPAPASSVVIGIAGLFAARRRR